MSNIKNIEYERTFLLRALPKGLEKAASTRMIDIYIPADLNKHPRIRLRRKADKFEFTKKTPINTNDASSHTEMTIPLTETEFIELSKASDRAIYKTRYFLNFDGKEAELDIFEESLRGFALLDFEFLTKEEMEEFIPPGICLADVTQEKFIAGGLLAGRGYTDIEDELKKFGYEKL